MLFGQRSPARHPLRPHRSVVGSRLGRDHLHRPDLTIHKWVDATDVNNGVAVVPAAAVSAFLAACSTDKVTLDLGDRLTVTCGDA